MIFSLTWIVCRGCLGEASTPPSKCSASRFPAMWTWMETDIQVWLCFRHLASSARMNTENVPNELDQNRPHSGRNRERCQTTYIGLLRSPRKDGKHVTFYRPLVSLFHSGNLQIFKYSKKYVTYYMSDSSQHVIQSDWTCDVKAAVKTPK